MLFFLPTIAYIREREKSKRRLDFFKLKDTSLFLFTGVGLIPETRTTYYVTIPADPLAVQKSLTDPTQTPVVVLDKEVAANSSKQTGSGLTVEAQETIENALNHPVYKVNKKTIKAFSSPASSSKTGSGLAAPVTSSPVAGKKRPQEAEVNVQERKKARKTVSNFTFF